MLAWVAVSQSLEQDWKTGFPDDSLTYLLVEGLSTGCLSVLMTWRLVSTRLGSWVNEKEKASGKMQSLLWPSLGSQIRHFYNILLDNRATKPSPHSWEGELDSSSSRREYHWICEDILKPPHRNSLFFLSPCHFALSLSTPSSQIHTCYFLTILE